MRLLTLQKRLIQQAMKNKEKNPSLSDSQARSVGVSNGGVTTTFLDYLKSFEEPVITYGKAKEKVKEKKVTKKKSHSRTKV